MSRKHTDNLLEQAMGQINEKAKRNSQSSPVQTEKVQSTSKLVKSKPSKSKRMQILITPDLYQVLTEIKESTGVSMNEIINQVLLNHLDEYR